MKLRKKIKRRIVLVIRRCEENLFGRYIIKNNHFAAPDFIIIGAAKAGTTSLFQYLSQHPEVIPSKKKELSHFSSGYKRSLRWYLQNFPSKEDKQNKLTFEASPSYLYSEEALRRIKRLLPEIKLIVILRDPVKRAFSQWTFHRDSVFVLEKPKLKDNRPFRVAVDSELNSTKLISPSFQYINRSMYSKHLKALYGIFPPKQVLTLDFEELKVDPQKVLKKITDFLNVAPAFDSFNKTNVKVGGLLETRDTVKSNVLKIYNVSNYKEKMDKETEVFLRSYFNAFDEEIVQLTGKKFSWMK